MLITLHHFLVRQRQPRCFVLSATALVGYDPLQAFLIVHDLVHCFLARLSAEVHALHLLRRLLEGLPVLLGRPAVHGGGLLRFECASIPCAVVNGSAAARINYGHANSIATGNESHLLLLGRCHIQVIGIVRVELTLWRHLLVRLLVLRLLLYQIYLLHRHQLLHLLLVPHDVLQLLLHFQFLRKLGTLALGRQIVLRVDARLARLV